MKGGRGGKNKRKKQKMRKKGEENKKKIVTYLDFLKSIFSFQIILE